MKKKQKFPSDQELAEVREFFSSLPDARTLQEDNDTDEFVDAAEVFPDLKDPQKRIGITFRGIRSKTGLTQKEVAEKLGLDQADVSKIEEGTCSIDEDLAKKIEKIFKIGYRRFL